ncbi:hypothetical protein E4K67_04205 [Desulfosporosinus fructosivorans]|uniref:Uncharacterized protein n=1 Tax=Desulfosporosinus fructosivorans TaxID=2018669 RepID=A0A4Z0R9G4_9FIRM|nr:hypothetical protein [Desulfosporosinus fructosivorans]TGE38697.1 hypothetical protein E4K67_04205 [Desulfosporosinus fructosivorans]
MFGLFKKRDINNTAKTIVQSTYDLASNFANDQMNYSNYNLKKDESLSILLEMVCVYVSSSIPILEQQNYKLNEIDKILEYVSYFMEEIFIKHYHISDFTAKYMLDLLNQRHQTYLFTLNHGTIYDLGKAILFFLDNHHEMDEYSTGGLAQEYIDSQELLMTLLK